MCESNEGSSIPAAGRYTGATAKRYEAVRRREGVWKWEDQIVCDFVATLSDGAVVLDVPVGTGRFFPHYGDRRLQVIGCDISQDMVNQSESRSMSLGEPGWDVRQGNATALPFDDMVANAVVCTRFIQWLPRISIVEQVLREFRRVSNGQLLLEVRVPLEPGESKRRSAAARTFDPWVKRISQWGPHPVLLLHRLVEKRNGSGNRPTLSYYTESELKQAALKAGWLSHGESKAYVKDPTVRFMSFIPRS